MFGAVVRATTKYIVIHCSWSPRSFLGGIKDIDRWHRLRGFMRVGYHYVIPFDGTLQKGRDLSDVGAHVARNGHNHDSVGICLIGGMAEGSKEDEDNFTDEQKLTLDGVIRTLMDFYPEAAVVGHSDLDNRKTCPVMDVTAFLEARGLLEENQRRLAALQ